MTRITIAAVLLAAIMLLNGCGDLNGNGNKKGRLITFTSQTGEVGTKTHYGDDYKDGNTTWQYIVWDKTDVIRIVSDNATCASGLHYADYAIDTVTANANHRSYAKIKPTPNGLEWAETSTYQFYSVTPPPGTGAVVSIYGPDSGNETYAYDDSKLGQVTVTLPSTAAVQADTEEKTVTAEGKTYTYTVYKPDMNYAVMTASEAGDYSGIDSVRLVFKPAFTAFEFNLTSADEDLTVTKVELVATATSDFLTGTYVFKAGSDIASGIVQTSGTGNSRSVSMTMNETLTTSTTTSTGVTLTFFTIPIVNRGMLSLKVTTNQGTATLNLTDTDKTSAYKFQPGKKYRVNLLKVGETWKIFFDVAVDPWIDVEPATTIII